MPAVLQARRPARVRSTITSTMAAWKEAQRSATSVSESGAMRSATRRTAVLRPDSEKSGFGRPCIGRGKSNRSGSPLAASRSTDGPPG